MKKIAICIFNRATYARCKTFIECIESDPCRYETHLVLSGALLHAKHGNAADYIKRNHADGCTIHEVFSMEDDGTHIRTAEIAAQIMKSMASHFDWQRYDAVVLVADRYETLPAAMAASYLNIPIVHLQGGETTGNIDDRVRNAVSCLSDYHFTSTSKARLRLLNGFKTGKSRTFHVGCPSLDLFKKNRVYRTTPRERYLLCIFHPETERSSEAMQQTSTVYEAVISFCQANSIVCHWYYPNPDPGREAIIQFLDSKLKSPFFKKAKNSEPEVFAKLLAGSRLIVGNSSCGIREASFLGVPSVNVGDRQRGREHGHNVVNVGYSLADITAALAAQNKAHRYTPSYIYGEGLSRKKTTSRLRRIANFTLRESE